MAPLLDLSNRISKNFRTLKNWAKSHEYECFRVYDRDIPEFPLIIDRYQDFAVIWSQAKKHLALPEEKAILHAVGEALNIDPSHCIYKVRERMAGSNQYEKLGSAKSFQVVKEGRLKFQVNLNDYLDTGLFLDTRTIRQTMIPKANPGQSFLNLFAYTGTLSVAAAKQGFHTVSVDLSHTYLNWARDNFQLNGINPLAHGFVHEDAIDYLARYPRLDDRYDWIYLDPPSFSNSKRMQGTLDVKRDHSMLIANAMKRLKPGGTLLFVTNLRSFKLAPDLAQQFSIVDLSEKTTARDMRRHNPHRCYMIRA